MDRNQLLAAAQAKHEREQLIAQAKAKHSGTQEPVMNVKDEQSPEVSFGDRFIAKNFAADPLKQVAYIKQEHPDLDVKLINGQVAIRKPSDNEYKVLDPSKFDMQDISDLAYDVPAGVLQGLATTAGAAAGAVTPVPGGALMGGSLASGASGAGLEAFRQKLGQWLGVPQDVNTKQVAMSGATGLASPLLFGAGKPAASAVAALAAKQGITEEAAQKALEGAGRGAIERGWDFGTGTVLPKLGELTSGVPADTIRAYGKHMDTVDNLERTGVLPYTQQLTDKIGDTLGEARDQAGNKVQAAMEGAGKQVNSVGAKNAFQDRIIYLQSKSDLSNAEAAELQSLKNSYDKYFGLATPQESYHPSIDGTGLKTSVQNDIPDNLDAARAFDLQKKLKQAAAFESNMTPETLSAKGSARNAYGALNSSMEDATNGLSQEAKDNYAKQMQIESELGSNFDTAQKTYNTVTGLNNKGKKMLAERLKQMSDSGQLDITPEVETLQAYNAFANPSMVPVGLKGATSTSRSVPLAVAGGTLGSLMGYKAGGGYSGATVGGALGFGLGNMLGSPQTIKNTMKANRWLESAGQAIQPSAGYGAYLSPAGAQIAPWMLMDQPQQPQQ